MLLVDFMLHDRAEYGIQLGHVWQGFDEPQVTNWLEQAGFSSARYRALPADPAAKGPSLFAATARKKTRKNGPLR
jgi:ArsR family transcriptional regulator